ncbi:C39 family peptidase [Pseudanabaena sp. PCC 6802]|uniref:C39 family peptidase n=1 Tax=Pseudanabaena sp. PCC 6802 TaxID=118173 RepID=UPI000348ED9A|nr:C39 family peptidase [Pseudanabaena sp. PCC 6802]
MMTQVQEWRRQAAQNLANRIPKIEGDLNNFDLAVDDVVRLLNNQPTRPAGRKAYEGIFPVDKLAIELDVPFYAQTDNYSQPDRTCNSSSCAMAAKYLGANLSGDDEYLQIVLTHGDTTDHSAQTDALVNYGIESAWYTNLDFDDLDESLAANLPVVIAILHRGSEDAPTGGHIIVVIGRTENGDYIVNDPYGDCNDGYTSDVYNGKGAIYSRTLLKARWLVEGSKSGWGRLFIQPAK